jgi:hypothetical protein
MVNDMHLTAVITAVAVMFLVFTGLLNGAGAHAPAEKENVIAVVQQLLDVLETGDIQKGKKTVIPGAFLAAVLEGNSENPVNFRTFDEFFNSLAQSGDKSGDRRKETMSGLEVMMHGNIALVWGDYKLFLNRQLHHCGVNAFSLIKKQGAWKIANVVYTYETVGCETLNSAAVPVDDRAKKEITSVVRCFLDMLATRDVSKSGEILISKGLSASWRREDGEEVVKIISFKELTGALPQETRKYNEVITDPGVLIHKGIGILRAGYKFYIDGKFSHEGVDIFGLIRTAAGWRIAGLVYTVQKK